MNTQDWSPLRWTGWVSLNSKGILRVFSNTTVQKHQFFGAQLSNNTREDSTHGHYQMVNTEIRLIIFFAAKDGDALYSQQIRLGADCESVHELLIAKFRLKESRENH